MKPATVLCCLATAHAFTRPQTRRAPTVRRQAVDVNALPFYTVAETGAGADDPFLLSLAGASIGLFIFVVGGAAYLTFQEQQSKKSIEEEDTKPRLPTLAELEAEGVRRPRGLRGSRLHQRCGYACASRAHYTAAGRSTANASAFDRSRPLGQPFDVWAAFLV